MIFSYHQILNLMVVSDDDDVMHACRSIDIYLATVTHYIHIIQLLHTHSLQLNSKIY